MKVIVVGSGVAGLTCALSLIEQGHSVTIITKSRTADSATWYAQGGIASAMFPDDSAQAHLEDTMTAGAGLCERSAVQVLVENGAAAVHKLISRGAQFDTLADGSYARTREGGHHNNRIIHAGGDATGEEIERSLVKATENKFENLEVIDFSMLSALLVDDRKCVGVECVDANGTIEQIQADHVVLATGGAGQLYAVTTNPILATADGLGVALEAGVVCTDLEFMQFHPTALHVDNMPRPLISEALRGEGSILRDENGKPFMQYVHELKDLAPRDVVSREIARVLKDHDINFVYLDATHIKDFSRRFPTIFSSCEAAGIDPSKDFLPVSPAAHYFCGGIATDIFGASSMPGLWAAGEVACNGVHGANRLASNSLLEGLVFGERVALAIDKGQFQSTPTGIFSNIKNDIIEATQPIGLSTFNMNIDVNDAVDYRSRLQSIMTKNVGVVRSKDSLQVATNSINELEGSIRVTQTSEGDSNDFTVYELKHLLNVSKCVINAATTREESRGCHTREDFPDTKQEFLGRQVILNVNETAFVPMDEPV